MTKKKTAKTKTIWIVLQDELRIACFRTFAEAKRIAEEAIEENESSDVQIFEVVKAWEIHWPEEPAPEIWEVGLDTL